MSTLDTIISASSARFSRRTLFKGAGALSAGVLLAQSGLLRSVAAGSESVSDIINIASTAEAMAVTLLGGAIDSAVHGGYNTAIPAPVISILKAAQSEEEYHLEFLLNAGAKPLTETFNVPNPKLLSDTTTLFTTIVELEGAFIAAYMAGAAEFTTLNQPGLVKVAYEIAGTEAEHRVLANYALGTRPANNVAFEPKMFNTVGDAAAALEKLGFIGGTGTAVKYPGAGGIDNTGVIDTTPTGPSVNCMAPAPPTKPGSSIPTAPVSPIPGAWYSKVTGHNVSGGFRAFWEKYGGLATFGYPLTEEFNWNGLRVQYFERARFEWHPGARPAEWDVLLGLVGDEITQGRGGQAPFMKSSSAGGMSWNGVPAPANVNAENIYFPQTGHNLGGGFRAYWQKFGDLTIFGFPISEEFKEQNPDDGKTYTVQYFERARFEWHPGEWPSHWDIELGRLGAEILAKIMAP